jgi:hypothetical protein
MLDNQTLVELIRRINALEVLMRRPTAEILTRDIGTYVPTYLGGTTPGVTTYAYQVGSWQRVGAWIQVVAALSWTAATGTGQALISLPFPSANITNFTQPLTIYTIGVTFAASGVQVAISPNTSVCVLNSPTSNGGSSLIQVEAAGTIFVGGSYLAQ